MARRTKHGMIAELADRGLTKRQAYNELKPLVESQIDPMVFKRNHEGRRIAKPLHEQFVELKNQIGRSYKLIGRSVDDSFESEEIPAEEPSTEEPSTPEISDNGCDNCGKVAELFHDEESGLSLCEDCLPTPEETPTPTAKRKRKIQDELQKFITEVRRIRAFCIERAAKSETLDHISMRPAQAAAKLIPAGIPADALLAAMAMHWPDDAKKDAGIPEFDFVAFSREVMESRGISGVNGQPAHEMFGYALILAECRQPIMAIGPAGTGKSHLARQLAAFLELDYSETPMSPGATRGDLLGRHTIGGFISAEFSVRYGSGGVFNFEEIDSADPSMLIVLNNALAGDKLFNSASGEEIERSDSFVAFSTANTFGLGANRDYTARERLDAATIDRWRMGRIWISLDENVENDILHDRV